VRPEDQFHVGIVVDDLDAALSQFSDLFGYGWCDEIAVTTRVTLPGGEVDLDMRFAYSMNEPRLEIIQQIPGTLWVPVGDSGIHHVGYWSDDVTRDSAELERRGLAREAAGAHPDGTMVWSYHRSASGPRIELVATGLRPALEQYWTTGRVPA
jgi:hypothetical protein